MENTRLMFSVADVVVHSMCTCSTSLSTRFSNSRFFSFALLLSTTEVVISAMQELFGLRRECHCARMDVWSVE